MRAKTALFAAILAISSAVRADITVPVQLLGDEGQNQTIGTVTFSQVDHGVLIKPELSRLTPGMHGFHLHVNPSCAQKGQAAGGHFDPQKTNVHLGPYNNNGHLGDLPALFVDQEGKASMPILAPRLKLEDFKGHAIMIHAGGDNYSDIPKALGGGGARRACAVIK